MFCKSTNLRIVFLSLIVMVSSKAMAQSECTVAVENLKGTYTGDCKNGLADGKGKATGKDMYEGNFKKGYPEGEGTYTFENKSYFRGNFKKGKMWGAGEFHYVKQDMADSIVTGFWEKDSYVGENEKPYVILSKSAAIVHISVREQKGMKGQLKIITLPKIKATIGGGVVWPIPVSYIGIVRGLYTRETKDMNERAAATTLYDVQFPFHAQIKIGNENLEIILYREAGWEIEMEID